MTRKCEKCSRVIARKRDRHVRDGIQMCRRCYQDDRREHGRPSSSPPSGLAHSQRVAGAEQAPHGDGGIEGRHGSAVVEESLGSLRSQVTLPEVSDRVQTLRHMLFLHSESGAASVEGAGRVEEGPGSPPVSQGGSAEPPRRGISAEQQQAPHGDEELEGRHEGAVVEDRLGVQPAPVRFWQRFVGREPLLGVREGGRRLFVPMPGDSSGSGSPSTTDPCGSGGDNSEDERGVEQQEPQVPAFLSDGGAGFRWLGVYKRDLNVGPEGEDPRRATWDEIRMLHLDGELYNSRRDMLQPMRSLNIRDMCFVNNEDAEERREIVVPEESDAQGATDDEGLAIPIRASRELDRLPIRIQLEEEQVVFPEVQIKLGIDRREDAPASRPKYYRVELPPYIIGPHMHASTFMVVPNWGMSFESLQDAQRCVIFHRAFCTAIEEISHCDPAGEQPWHLSALLGSEGVQGWMLTRFENAVRSIKRDMDLLFNHVYGEPAVVQEIPLPRHGYPATPCQEYLYKLVRIFSLLSFFDNGSKHNEVDISRYAAAGKSPRASGTHLPGGHLAILVEFLPRRQRE